MGTSKLSSYADDADKRGTDTLEKSHSPESVDGNSGSRVKASDEGDAEDRSVLSVKKCTVLEAKECKGPYPLAPKDLRSAGPLG